MFYGFLNKIAESGLIFYGEKYGNDFKNGLHY